jgi:hypothetical protein
MSSNPSSFVKVTSFVKAKQSLDRPSVFQDVDAPRFQNNWHMKVVMLKP